MWSTYKFEEHTIYSAKAGHMLFWIGRLNSFWQVATTWEKSIAFTSEGLKEVKSIPTDIRWNQLVAGKHNDLIIHPALPDRPVIIKPDESVAVLPSMKIELMIKIPLWIQLYSHSVKPQNLIYEFPSVQLRQTWFGDSDSGELAYRLPGNIFYGLAKDPIQKFEAVCPVRIHNESTSLMSFQRLSIHAHQLNLYTNGDIFCTNELRVSHKEEEQESDVQIVNGSPGLAGGHKQISDARIKTNTNLLRKSFHMLKSFTQY